MKLSANCDSTLKEARKKNELMQEEVGDKGNEETTDE